MTDAMTASRRPGGAESRQLRRRRIYDAIVLAVALALALPVARLLQLPPRVDEITVSNPTAYDIGVDVTGGEGAGWMSVGTAGRTEATTFNEVIDQGRVWVFRFSAQGRDGGELRVPRTKLEADRWRIAIPDEVARTLAERGAPTPP